jgi:hypothetical protein
MLLALAQQPPADGVVYVASAIAILIAVLMLAFWGWMLTDCLRNELPGSKDKIFWAILIFVTGLPGAFIYNIGRRRKRIRELGQ